MVDDGYAALVLKMGIPLAYNLHGKALDSSQRAVIILHGLFGSSRNWRSIGESISKRHQLPVYTVDMRNHGMTARSLGAKEMSWQLMKTDLCNFIESRNHAEYTVIGHSLGGQVVMQSKFMGERVIDDLVKRMIVVDVAPKSIRFSGSQISRLLDRMILLEEKEVKSRAEAASFIREIEPKDSVVQFLLSNGSVSRLSGAFKFDIPLKALREGMYTLQNTYDDVVKHPVSTETLFIRGGKSDFIQIPEDTDLIKHLFPNSQLRTMENVGHWPHHEDPETFIQLIDDHILS